MLASQPLPGEVRRKGGKKKDQMKLKLSKAYVPPNTL